MNWSEDALRNHPSRRIREQYAAQSAKRWAGVGPELSARLAVELPSPEKPRKTRRGDGFDSKLEAARWEFHQGRKAAGLICDVLRQPRFELPGGMVYTADFAVIGCELFGGGYGITVEEVKGSRKAKNARDSWTRFRIAAGLYGWARWLWVERKGGEWVEQEVNG